MTIPSLSEVGQIRQQQILEAVLSESVRLRKRRKLRHGALICCLALCAGVGITSYANRYLGNRVESPRKDVPRQIATDGPLRVHPVDRPDTSVVSRLATDPTVLDKYVIPSGRKPQWAELIDDRELMTELAAIDYPAGLVRANGRAWTKLQLLAMARSTN